MKKPARIILAMAAALMAAGIGSARGASFSGGTADGYAMGTATNTLGGIPTAITSASSQTFARGPASGAAAAITIADGAPAPLITVAGGIRITIPASGRFTWNPAVTTPSFGGSAAGKVAATCAYADGNRTLVVTVTANFAAADTLTISGLSFTNLLIAGRPVRMEVDVTNDGLPDAFNDKTAGVTMLRPGGRGDGYGVDSMTQDASFVPRAVGSLITLI
jgi:hypothetical protein